MADTATEPKTIPQTLFQKRAGGKKLDEALGESRPPWPRQIITPIIDHCMKGCQCDDKKPRLTKVYFVNP